MWLAAASASAFFAGITAILAKCGIRKTDSTVVTALRTVVVLIAAWAMVFITGVQDQIGSVSARSWVFLVLSGLSTGASWLCYFKALSCGPVNKVVPIDKSSTALTVILAFIFLGERLSAIGTLGLVLMTAGTFMMIKKKDGGEGPSHPAWLPYALGSALFASLTSILGKVGIEGVDSNLGTAVRTFVVLIMAWLMIPATGKAGQLKHLDKKELVFITLSGLATGASWLCYYRALQNGPASLVAPIDKLSILVSIAFARIVYKERLSRMAAAGLVLLTAGTLLMLV